MIDYSLDTKEIIDGLRRMRSAGLIDKKKEAFTRIGVELTALIKKNYLTSFRKVHGTSGIKTGNLFNSFEWRLLQKGIGEGVEVGSYGVPYAAIHEFGFNGDAQVPGHTVKGHTRRITKAFGRDIKARNVEVRPYTVSAHLRKVDIKEKRFMTKSLAAYRKRILFIIERAYGWSGK